jgi:citrate lyase gamma subunit
VDKGQFLALDFLIGDQIRKNLKKQVHQFQIREKQLNNEERIVTGVVLRARRVDDHGDIMRPEEIRKAAHHWMATKGFMGLQHMQT